MSLGVNKWVNLPRWWQFKNKDKEKKENELFFFFSVDKYANPV